MASSTRPDYTVWRNNLGMMVGSGSSQAPSAVPEPNAVALGLMTLLVVCEATAMTVRRAIMLSLLHLLPSSVLKADTLVIRDSIGADSSLTDGMPGGTADHDGADWGTPGSGSNCPEDGELAQARFVIFAYNGLGPDFAPENNLANIYGYPMEFHVWTDGIGKVGVDSFDENPQGSAVQGHIEMNVNSSTQSFINVVPFGQTEDGPDMFTTFLVTIDLSSFNIALQVTLNT